MAVRKSKKVGVTKADCIPVSPLDALVRKLDLVACELETRWGYGVLHSLAGSDTAAKWVKVKDKLDDAILGGDYDTVKKYSEMLIRGWEALERETLEAGHKPHGVDTVWFVASPNSGIEYIICKNDLDAARLVVQWPEKASSVYRLGDLAKMIEAGSLPQNLSKEDPFMVQIMASREKLMKRASEPMESDTIPI